MVSLLIEGETHMYFVGEEFLTDQNITQVSNFIFHILKFVSRM